MSAKRPGGLTALAVINFVLSGWCVLVALGLLTMLQFADRIAADLKPDERAAFQAIQDHSEVFWAFVGSYAIMAGLLIAAGVGYLKLKRFLGRTLGNTYALLGIGNALFGAFAVPAEIGGGVSIGTIISLIYPVLTLFLLNLTFKEDFTR